MSGDEPMVDQQPSRRLKLVLKTSPLSTPVDAQAYDQGILKDGSSSPPRPSYSPVTPTGPHEFRATPQENPPTQWIDEPPSLPLSLEDNADVIALKATISLLQMQRQQSVKDIRHLDKIKDAALDDPRGFADDLRAGKLKKPLPADIVFDDIECEDDEAQTEVNDVTSRFGCLPNPQNIARCPPIEWSKYHIIGKPLDDLHELQRRYPGVSESDIVGGSLQNDHNTTAPYRPFKDKLDDKKQTR